MQDFSKDADRKTNGVCTVEKGMKANAVAAFVELSYLSTPYNNNDIYTLL